MSIKAGKIQLRQDYLHLKSNKYQKPTTEVLVASENYVILF